VLHCSLASVSLIRFQPCASNEFGIVFIVISLGATIDLSPRDYDNGAIEIITIDLIIRYLCVFIEPPTVTLTVLESNNAFFIVNASYRLRCSSAGFPVANLLWFWQPCLNFGCHPSDDHWQPKAIEDNNPELFQVGLITV